MVLEDVYYNTEPVAGCVTAAVVTVDPSPVLDVGGSSVHILTR